MMEGGTTAFSCVVTVNGVRSNVFWKITKGHSITLNSTQRFRSTNFYVGSEYLSPLTLTGVSKELHGASVRCGASDGGTNSFQSGYGSVNVLCEC